MVCTDDDRSHVEPTVKFYMELLEKKIPTEMHIYTYGGHGYALRPDAEARARHDVAGSTEGLDG